MAAQSYESHRHNPVQTGVGFFFVLLAAYVVFTTLPTGQQLVGGAIIVTGILCLLYGRRSVRRAGETTLVFNP